MAFDAQHGLTILFGGSDCPRCDMWAFDGRDWIELQPADRPPPRSLHAMAAVSQRGRIVVFGGASAGGYLNDTWEWDGEVWIRSLPQHAPPPRLHTDMAYDSARGVCVLFGGAANGRNFGDTWEWNGVDWLERAPVAAPTPRFDHGMAFDPLRQRTVLFGGQTPNTTCNQTWLWDGTTWTQALPANTPPARLEHAMVFADDLGAVVLFGGRSRDGTLFDDTWLWTGANWLPQQPAHHPAPRGSHRLVYDAAHQQIVGFGGALDYEQPFDDTWAFSTLPHPARHEVFGQGCAGSAGDLPRLDLQPGGMPWLGETFALWLEQLPRDAVGLLMFGLSDTHYGLLILPADLSSYGMPGCTLYCDPPVWQLFTATGSGQALVQMQLPPLTSLAGLQVFHQALILDPAANARGFTLSNAGIATLGARSD